MKRKLVLVVNCGSSSLKYQLINPQENEPLAKGLITNIGTEISASKQETADGKVKDVRPVPDHTAAIRWMLEKLTDPACGVISSLKEISAVGHRVLHGGARLTSSVLITEEVKKTIADCIPLGPLHNPANLTGIEICEKLMPGIPQAAVFDTAFHQTMPPKAYRYGIPKEYYEKYQIRRYGFHGTSHRYVSRRACEVLGIPQEGTKMIVCHLGSGSSISAVKDGKCVDTTMGLTPLEGVLMGTRSGSLDPAVVSFLAEKLNLSASEVVDDILNKKSGLLGVTGKTPGMKEVIRLAEEEHDPDAMLALDMMVYGVQKYIGAYTVAMGGLDALVFTAGVGENSAPIRKRVTEGLGCVGVKLDYAKNEAVSGSEAVISALDSKVTVMVVPTNEELMIALDTIQVTEEMTEKKPC